jgi:hypothetical protein
VLAPMGSPMPESNSSAELRVARRFGPCNRFVPLPMERRRAGQRETITGLAVAAWKEPMMR